VYLSGRFSTDVKIEKEWLHRTKCKYRCFSFANIYPKTVYYSKNAETALDVCEKKGIGIMLDSGAYSFHRWVASTARRGKIADERKDIDIEAMQRRWYRWYSRYCLKHGDKWDFYFTLDYKMHQPTIYAMQEQFIKDGLHPIPVYHGDSDLDWLLKQKELCGKDLIGIGRGLAIRGHRHKGQRFYVDQVFNYGAKHGIKFHGLAMTSLSMISAYPWYSVDSSTWVQSAIFGMLIFPDREKNTNYNLHISERATKTPVASYNTMTSKQQAMVRETITDMGFTMRELRDEKDGLEGRHIWNGYMFANIFDIVDTKKEKVKRWEPLW
jgi:hypothetical protein